MHDAIVENIVHEDSIVALALESPHVDEVFHGYPLAGDSGREISKYLLGRYDIPIGLVSAEPSLKVLLKLKINRNFSILNISKRPLQKSAYVINGLPAPKEIEHLEKLKELLDNGATYDTKHKKKYEIINIIKKEIYEEFKQECESKLKDHRFIIPCGQIALTFCQKLKINSKILNFEIIEGIPHPSSGWLNIRQSEIDAIIQMINEGHNEADGG